MLPTTVARYQASVAGAARSCAVVPSAWRSERIPTFDGLKRTGAMNHLPRRLDPPPT